MMKELFSQTMPWYIAGPLISLVMFTLIYWGKTFGVSGNYRNICAMVGLGRSSKFFEFDWKKEKWNLTFVLGTVIGAALTHFFIPNGQVPISEQTVADLQAIGIAHDQELAPMQLFGLDQLFTLRTLVILVAGGFLVGFGTRYAGGCTSGHAITGLSDLQPSSLIAVIGFFIGGLLMTHLLLPYIIAL